MNEVVRFELDDGSEALFEVSGDLTGIQRASRDESGVLQAQQRFETALASVAPAAKRVLDSVHALSPDEQEVEFGIRVNAEAGVIIAKSSGEANFRVKLTWRAAP